MSREPLMPEVLDGFTAALVSPRRRRRWFVPRVLGTGLVVLAVGGTAVAAVAPEVPWNPFGGRSASVSGPGTPVSLAPPPADQTDTLAVLRRAQNDRDHGPLVSAWLRRFKSGEVDWGRIRIRYVRFLREVEVQSPEALDGRTIGKVRRGSLYLIPYDAAGVKQSRADFGFEEFCLVALYDDWPAGGPAPDRRGRDPQSGGRRATQRPASLEDRVTGGGPCGSAHTVRIKGLAGAGSYGRSWGIVPDGVAAVRARTRDGQMVTSRVENNAYELLAPGRDRPQDGSDTGQFAERRPPKSGQLRSGSYEWLDASGKVIRRMPY